MPSVPVCLHPWCSIQSRARELAPGKQTVGELKTWTGLRIHFEGTGRKQNTYFQIELWENACQSHED